MALVTGDFVEFFLGLVSALKNWLFASAVHPPDRPAARLSDFYTLFKRSRSVADDIGTRLKCTRTWRDVIAANIAESSRCTPQGRAVVEEGDEAACGDGSGAVARAGARHRYACPSLNATMPVTAPQLAIAIMGASKPVSRKKL